MARLYDAKSVEDFATSFSSSKEVREAMVGSMAETWVNLRGQ